MPTARTFQLDVDTKRYCNRVNVFRKLNGLGNLLPPDIADIDNFVVGLKDLGIWTNIVCWLMGSRYNVGAGTVALSINNIYDATLVSSPTWNTNWIDTSPTNAYILVPYNHVNKNSETGSVITGLANFGSNYALITTSRGSVNGWEYGIANATNKNYFWISGGTINITRVGLNTNNIQFYSFSQTNGAKRTRWNQTTTTAVPVGQVYPAAPYTTVGYSASAQAAVKCSFLIFLKNIVITDTQHDSIESLVKTTIGKYLALP